MKLFQWSKKMKRLVQLTEIVETGKCASYTALSDDTEEYKWVYKPIVRSVYINPEHVAVLREDEELERRVKDKDFAAEIGDIHKFTKVYLVCGGSYQNSNITVLGPLSYVAAKLEGDSRM
tara:strand:- start:214 stop:573 length:360 start_codon:yes stop_codon:yes gene_type:complete